MTTDITTHPLWNDQLALEEEMRSLGISRFRDGVAKMQERGQETRSTAVRRLMGHAHADVVKAIEAFQDAALRGKGGRRHSALPFLKLVGDVDLIAHMTIRSVLDGISSRETLTRVALNVSTLLEDECHFRAFEEWDAGMFARTHKRAMKGTVGNRSRSMLIPARKHGAPLQDWGPRAKLLVGVKLVELFVEATGLATIVRVGAKSAANTPVYVEATPETVKWLQDENARLEWLSPAYMPTIIPPRPWTSPWEGGYWTRRVRRLTLVKTRNREYLEELATREMPSVYAAINAVQGTPWAINRRVLEVMDGLWEAQSSEGIIPSAEGAEMPVRPAWLTPEMTREQMSPEQVEIFKAWKQKRAEVHQSNAQAISRRLSFVRMLNVAKRFAEFEEIFFPHTLDWRGRVYPVTLYLTPQGNDAQRGLLEFARAVPLTNEDGVLWLAVHGAGLWGVDKVSLEARRAWVEENEAAVLASAEDPLNNRFWMTAEKPWQALAFCFDWAGWKAEGYAYASCLPVQMDGTCNGLQNFSAILRDEVGGRAVNLVPGETPNDIYATVAEIVAEKVAQDADRTDRVLMTRKVRGEDGAERKEKVEGPEVGELARGWIGRVNRKVTKRPVMTLAYGARQFGFKEQVMQDTVRGMQETLGDAFPWTSGWQAASYMGDLIWSSVGEVVVAAREAMDWLQGAASQAAKQQLPVMWSTPSGFLAQQAYRLPNQQRIETTFESVRITLSISQETTRIDSRKQAAGISPNWVHSLDASHLTRTVEAAEKLGMQSFSMVHDSYGTHAGNCQTLANVLREEFVRMYSETDVLETFRDELKAQLGDGEDLPPLPAKGTLDLSQVLDSRFFFA